MASRLEEIEARLQAAKFPEMETRRDNNPRNYDDTWAAVAVDDEPGHFPLYEGGRERTEYFAHAPADIRDLLEVVKGYQRRDAARAAVQQTYAGDTRIRDIYPALLERDAAEKELRAALDRLEAHHA